jgi:hypothetical protein
MQLKVFALAIVNLQRELTMDLPLEAFHLGKTVGQTPDEDRVLEQANLIQNGK